MPIHAPRGRHRLHIIAMERVPHALAIDVAPEIAELFGLCGQQGLHAGDAGALQPDLQSRADPGNVFQGHAQQGRGHVAWMPDRRAIRLVHLAGGLGQEPVGGKADRAGDIGTDIVRDAVLQSIRQAFRRAPVPRIQAATKLINGFDGLDRDLAGDLV